MEVKKPESPASPPQSIIQEIQMPGNPVIFKSDAPSSVGLKVSSHTIKTMLASFVMLILVGGVGVGVYLVGQQQKVKSRASNEQSSSTNEIPDNLSTVVPKEVVSQSATKSAEATRSSRTASGSGSLNSIVIPQTDSSVSAIPDKESYDFNGDNAANSLDLSIMYAGWGTPKNDQQRKADINKDGTVNGIDYSIFLPHFNSTL
jgi:hypothetical protein